MRLIKYRDHERVLSVCVCSGNPVQCWEYLRDELAGLVHDFEFLQSEPPHFYSGELVLYEFHYDGSNWEMIV